MRIHPRLTGTVMSFIITLGMSLVMSFTMTAINVGFTEYFLYAWVRSWLVGLLVGFPTAAVIVPLAQKVVIRRDGEISDHQQSWGYEEGPSKGPEPCSAGNR